MFWKISNKDIEKDIIIPKTLRCISAIIGPPLCFVNVVDKNCSKSMDNGDRKERK